MVAVGAHVAAQLGDARLGVVRVGGREVREDLAAVDPLPRERVVLGRVEAVPRELLREEPRDPGLAHELRELAGVAEDVGLPELGAAPAELALEEALAVEELAGERLAGRQVAVGLDPRPADRRPLPARDALADVVPQRRVALADPGVVLGLRGAEDVLGVLVHAAAPASRTCAAPCARSPRAATARRCRGGRGRPPTARAGRRPRGARRARRGSRRPAPTSRGRRRPRRCRSRRGRRAARPRTPGRRRPRARAPAGRRSRSTAATRRGRSGRARSASSTNGERVRYGPCAPSPTTP